MAVNLDITRAILVDALRRHLDGAQQHGTPKMQEQAATKQYMDTVSARDDPEPYIPCDDELYWTTCGWPPLEEELDE